MYVRTGGKTYQTISKYKVQIILQVVALAYRQFGDPPTPPPSPPTGVWGQRGIVGQVPLHHLAR